MSAVGSVAVGSVAVIPVPAVPAVEVSEPVVGTVPEVSEELDELPPRKLSRPRIRGALRCEHVRSLSLSLSIYLSLSLSSPSFAM